MYNEREVPVVVVAVAPIIVAWTGIVVAVATLIVAWTGIVIAVATLSVAWTDIIVAVATLSVAWTGIVVAVATLIVAWTGIVSQLRFMSLPLPPPYLTLEFSTFTFCPGVIFSRCFPYPTTKRLYAGLRVTWAAVRMPL